MNQKYIPDVPQIEVNLPIKLGQFLKLADLVEYGATARFLIQSGDVLVNQEVETRRGRMLADGDLVTLEHPQGSRSVQVAQG